MIEIMQKRIEEIKQADRKAYYELANEIGISEYSLYSFMTRDECSANTENKINSYLRGYLTKDEKLEAYRLDNEELKAENDRLKAENYGLNQELLGYKKGVQASEIVELKQTLQEIKKYIAKICKEECGYVQKKRCPDCDCRYGAILDLITKAEEKWK